MISKVWKNLSLIGPKLNHVVQNLTNDIILVLLRDPLHTRGIAETLGRSHSTMIRRLQDLVQENILDFTLEGRNKVYSLKRSIEGRNAAIAAELYKQSQLVGVYPIFRGIIRTVLEIQEVQIALVFGSYAKGTAHDRSDIDLFIETDDRNLKKSLEGKFTAMSVKIGSFTLDNPLVREIARDHIIIKGVEKFFEKTKFFT